MLWARLPSWRSRLDTVRLRSAWVLALPTLIVLSTSHNEVLGADETPGNSPVAAIRYSDACVRQHPPTDFIEDYDTALEQWKATACVSPGVFDAVGTCEGLRFIKYGGGFTGTISYYDARTGEYVGGASWTDVAEGPCDGRVYFLRELECEDEVKIPFEELCGRSIDAVLDDLDEDSGGPRSDDTGDSVTDLTDGTASNALPGGTSGRGAPLCGAIGAAMIGVCAMITAIWLGARAATRMLL